MGNIASSIRAFFRQPTDPNQNTDNLRSLGTYFGPNFVLEHNGIGPSAASRTAYWEDILNILAANPGGGMMEAMEASAYSQLPPAELKTSSLIQSKVNIQKGSLRLARRKESKQLAYDLSFSFDTTIETKIKIYWGAKERVVNRETAVTYEFVAMSGEPVTPWEFGPFPSGMNQKFVLPDSHTIDNNLLRKINMGWVTGLDLAKSPVLLANNELPNFTENGQSITPIASVAVNIDERRKVETRNPDDPYKLIVVIESTGYTPANGDSQLNFTNFSSSFDGQLQIQFVKQILVQNGLSLVLQEIFGFSEAQSLVSSASNTGQKECVVCMSEIKDILVLPCRHLCMCKACAELLRVQGRDENGMMTRQGPPKCPICRQLFHSLVQIQLPPAYQWRLSSRVSLNMEGRTTAPAS